MSASACLYDASVWVALAFGSRPHHAQAKLELAAADSVSPAAFCQATQQAFLRLFTTPAVQKIHGSGFITNDVAWEKWEVLMALPQVVWFDDPRGLEKTWLQQARLRSDSPKVWMEACLAAFARSHAIPLATPDRDFTQFKGLSVCYLLSVDPADGVRRKREQ